MLKKFQGLSFKLSFFILFCSTLIFICTLYFNYVFSKNAVLININEIAKNLTFSTSNRIDKILLAATHINEVLKATLEYLKYTPSELDNLIKSIVKEHNDIFGCYIAFEPQINNSDFHKHCYHYYKNNDTLLCRDTINPKNYLSADWYDTPKNSEKPYWTEPFNNNTLKIEQVIYSVPFYKSEKTKTRFSGVIAVDISLDWIERYCSSIKIFQTGYAFLLSSKGNYISHPFKDSYSREDIYSIAKKYNDTLYTSIGKAMLKGDSGIAYYNNSDNAYQGRVFYAPLNTSPWFLGLFLPENELYSTLIYLNRLLFFIGFLGILILFVAIMLISKKITNPLKDLVLATEEISNGNYNIELGYLNRKDEIGILSKSFLKMQEDLKEDINKLRITTAQKEKIESELKIAKEIQMSMIPHKFPAFPDRQEFELYAKLESAKEVGGDLYNYFLIEDHLCIAIGDVSGKGIPASLFMAATEMLIRAKFYKVRPVNKVARNINNILNENNDSNLFVTLFLGLINLKTGDFEYFNAGHNPPYIIRANNQIEKLNEIHSQPLGMLYLECDYYSSTRLNSGDKLIMFTDGLTESMNEDFELFSEKRLERGISALKDLPPKEIIESLFLLVKEFSGETMQFDDITILSIEYF